MAEFYKVLKADPLGDPWTPNKTGAKPIQNYWCQVEGQEKAVSIGRQTDNPLRPGVHVYGDLMYAKSQKGTEYWKFKGQMVPEDVTRPTDDPGSPAQAAAQTSTGASEFADKWAADSGEIMPKWFVPVYNMLRDMHKVVTGQGELAEEATPPPTPEPAKKPEQLAGEPIDEETQATLDNIFGEPPTPEEK